MTSKRRAAEAEWLDPLPHVCAEVRYRRRAAQHIAEHGQEPERRSGDPELMAPQSVEKDRDCDRGECEPDEGRRPDRRVSRRSRHLEKMHGGDAGEAGDREVGPQSLPESAWAPGLSVALTSRRSQISMCRRARE